MRRREIVDSVDTADGRLELLRIGDDEWEILIEGFGALYSGTKGKLVVGGGDGGTYAEQKALDYEIPSDGVHPYKSPGHEQDWVNCMRSRKKPIMHIESGHRVATLCILGNISYRLGRKLEWDPVKECCIGDDEANRMLSRPSRAPWRI